MSSKWALDGTMFALWVRNPPMQIHLKTANSQHWLNLETNADEVAIRRPIQ